MKELVFSDLRKATVKRSTEAFGIPLHAWGPGQWGNAMQGEMGECGNELKKLERDALKAGVPFHKIHSHHYETDPVHAERIVKAMTELGDGLVYSDLIAARFGYTLDQCIRMSFNGKSAEKGWSGRI